MGGLSGIFRAVVDNVADPEVRGRILVKIPSLLGNKTTAAWAEPCRPVGDTSIPNIGDGVWIMFEQGDVEHPVWLGVWG